MSKILTPSGAAGQTALSPETTSIQPASEGTSPLHAAPTPVPGNTAKILRKQVRKAQQEFARRTVQLIKTEDRGFYLRVCLTLAYIWLKIGNKDDYVDEVLAKLHKQYEGAWVPSQSTLQHYEGPLLHWLLKLAQEKDPTDQNLPEKFTTVFLRKHPHYMLNGGKAQVDDLCSDCKTLVRLDRKHGNGCVKPEEQKAESKDIEPAVQTAPAGAITEPPQKVKPVRAKNERAQRSKLQSQPRQPTSAAEAESALCSKIAASAVNPSVPSKPTQAIANTSQTQAKTNGATPQRTQRCYPQSKPRRLSPATKDEVTARMNDELLEMLHGVQQRLLAMQEAGITTNRDVENAMLGCCTTVTQINSHFRPPALRTADAATPPGIATAAQLAAQTPPPPTQSPALSVPTNGIGSLTLAGPGATVPESAPIAESTSKHRRAAKRPVEILPEPAASLPGPEDDQLMLFPLPRAHA
jgi:hypothetical protein